MSVARSPEPPATALDRLAAELRALPAAIPGIEECRIGDLLAEIDALRFFERRAASGSRLRVVLLTGCSGAGKSTLFNALAGRAVSRSSIVDRPSTLGAVAAGSPAGIAALEEMAAGGLPLATAPVGALPTAGIRGTVAAVPLDAPDDLILVDCPDFNTTLEENRRLVLRLLRWADALVFVASAETYADRSGLEHLETARALGTPADFVLNRVLPETAADLRGHFAGQLRKAGIPGGDVLVVPLARNGAPDAGAVAELRSRLAAARSLPSTADRLVRVAEGVRSGIVEPARRARADLDRLAGRLRAASATPLAPDFSGIFAGLSREVRRATRLYRLGVRSLLDTAARLLSVLPLVGETFRRSSPPLPGREAWERARAGTLAAWRAELVRIHEVLDADPVGREWARCGRIGSIDPEGTAILRVFDDVSGEAEAWVAERLRAIEDAAGGAGAGRRFLESQLPKILVLAIAGSAAPVASAVTLLVGGVVEYGAHRLTDEVAQKADELRARFVRASGELRESLLGGAIDAALSHLPAPEALDRLAEAAGAMGKPRP